MEYNKTKVIVENIIKNIYGLYVSGSFRREEEVINELYFITLRNLKNVLEELQELYNTEIISNGEKYLSFYLITNYGKTKVDIWRGENSYSYKFLKWMRDMDKGHSIAYKKMAKEKNLTLSDYGLYDNDNNIYLDFVSIQGFKNFLKNKKFI